jgi:hypothetical protein
VGEHSRKAVKDEISLLLKLYEEKKHLPNPTAKSQVSRAEENCFFFQIVQHPFSTSKATSTVQ